MNTDCIDVISERLKELNIEYTSYIITNGSLITDDIIKKMSDLWNTKDIQITIDGTEDVDGIRVIGRGGRKTAAPANDSSAPGFKAKLRKKLQAGGDSQPYIQTHIGIGYRPLRQDRMTEEPQ